mgnify:CR=1 FL=1|jgi:hypothetical protein
MIDKNTEAPMTQNPCYGQFYRRKLISLCGVMWLKDKGLNDLKDKIVRSVSCIPNIEGYEFYSLHKDGSFNRNVVKKNENGLHYIDDFKNVIGWFPINCP